MAIDASGSLAWTPDTTGSFSVSLRVSDGQGGEALQDFTVVVQAANRAPRIITDPLLDAVSGQEYRYAVDATDADNDELSFS